MNRVCNMLGIQYPIFQGAMAWVANHSIAAAVSQAGGLGIIAAGNAPAEWLREEIRQCKYKTDKPFGVNIMLLSPHAEEVAKVVVEEGVKILTTGAGSPGKYLEMWQSNGIKVIPVVPSIAIAKRMEKSGVDAVIVEGCEAGGHIGELTTMVIVPQVVDALTIPVIAAGGIGDGRGFAASLMLGAEGIQVGTRFLLAKECDIHQNYKDRVIKANDIDTVVTGRSTGHPIRSIRNHLTREYLKLEKNGATPDELEKLGADSLRRAVVEGDITHGSVMAGQIAGMFNKEQTAQEIINELVNEAKDLLNNGKDKLNF
ncbi:2-nitropropane dioxygenase [Candidatus Epulonipiscium fishelsonii]|uniref:2-nitropropane dioxygenase n=1 Tax=Candidatus Epulonipiscium fishelsonii TaxID=77094 RepID=A0ACC8XB10_9FIRM|nr:2-nitropropane dioxygenase [Epulopiscium sp. SCG-B11WGA-EpuloA1]ONI41983.1 2-nitropropane dioxygenase [Epulopiscium sp. SCG-B05WGA-EpuloA1]